MPTTRYSAERVYIKSELVHKGKSKSSLGEGQKYYVVFGSYQQIGNLEEQFFIRLFKNNKEKNIHKEFNFTKTQFCGFEIGSRPKVRKLFKATTRLYFRLFFSDGILETLTFEVDEENGLSHLIHNWRKKIASVLDYRCCWNVYVRSHGTDEWSEGYGKLHLTRRSLALVTTHKKCPQTLEHWMLADGILCNHLKDNVLVLGFKGYDNYFYFETAAASEIAKTLALNMPQLPDQPVYNAMPYPPEESPGSQSRLRKRTTVRRRGRQDEESERNSSSDASGDELNQERNPPDEPAISGDDLILRTSIESLSHSSYVPASPEASAVKLTHACIRNIHHDPDLHPISMPITIPNSSYETDRHRDHMDTYEVTQPSINTLPRSRSPFLSENRQAADQQIKSAPVLPPRPPPPRPKAPKPDNGKALKVSQLPKLRIAPGLDDHNVGHSAVSPEIHADQGSRVNYEDEFPTYAQPLKISSVPHRPNREPKKHAPAPPIPSSRLASSSLPSANRLVPPTPEDCNYSRTAPRIPAPRTPQYDERQRPYEYPTPPSNSPKPFPRARTSEDNKPLEKMMGMESFATSPKVAPRSPRPNRTRPPELPTKRRTPPSVPSTGPSSAGPPSAGPVAAPRNKSKPKPAERNKGDKARVIMRPKLSRESRQQSLSLDSLLTLHDENYFLCTGGGIISADSAGQQVRASTRSEGEGKERRSNTVEEQAETEIYDISNILNHMRHQDPSYRLSTKWYVNILSMTDEETTPPLPPRDKPEPTRRVSSSDYWSEDEYWSARSICHTLHMVLHRNPPTPDTLKLSYQERCKVCLRLYINSLNTCDWRDLASEIGLEYQAIELIEAFTVHHNYATAGEIVLRHWQYRYNKYGKDPDKCPVECSRDGLISLLKKMYRQDVLDILNADKRQNGNQWWI